MKEADPDYRSWKDFFGLVPRRQELINHLHDNFKICLASLALSWSEICQYAVNVLLKLEEMIAKPRCTQEVQVSPVKQSVYLVNLYTNLLNYLVIIGAPVV
jgi:hypothetical protein